MKLGLIFASVIFGLFLGTGIALATTQHAPVSQPVIPAVEPGFSVTLPEPTLIEVAPITVYGTVPRKHVTAPKQFVCGEPHTMEQGPQGATVRDCSWR